LNPLVVIPDPPTSEIPDSDNNDQPLVCTETLPQDQCIAAGGSWSTVSYPPCSCP
jgi:hypothetical protein